MFNTGVPTSKYTLNDASGASTAVLLANPVNGLCVPFAFTLAERGVPNKMIFGAAAELNKAFGASTFDESSPYFNASTKMLGIAMAGGGVEAMRLVDPAAQVATFGLFLTVTNVSLTQYVKDASGGRVVDDNGDYIAQTFAGGTQPIVQPGVSLKWSVRQLAANETFDTLVPTTVQVAGINITTYPILAGEMSWQGKAGNRQGFKLASTGTDNSTLVQALGSAMYRFTPIELPTNLSTTASAIPDLLGNVFNDISFKDQAIYAATNTNYAFNYVIGNNYIDQVSGGESLPYQLHVYGKNVGIVAGLAQAVSPELAALDPYQIDLIAGTNFEGNLYDHIAIDPDSNTVVGNDVINYAQGGTDGDTSWAKFDSMVASWLAGDDHGDFLNLVGHPVTHFSDPGFSMPTKMLLLNMLDLRDDILIDIATQDIALKANTKAQDLSAGQAIMFRALLHPENVVTGVPCCRVSIYAHAAPLIGGSPTGGIVPFTLNPMVQRRDLDSGTYIKGSAGGRPNSEVTLFRTPNWVADDLASQQLSWASAINTVRHADRVVLHYPSQRTVYSNDTSLLSDCEVANRITYIRKLCRTIWSVYAGVRQPVKEIYPKIQKDIEDTLAKAFGSDNLKVKATVFQTAQDANLGYAVSINLAVTGNMAIRTFNFDVNVYRATS
jgi:hypothetical protein